MTANPAPWIRPNAAMVMTVLARSDRSLGVREISRISGVPVSTTHRLIEELVAARSIISSAVGGRRLLRLAPGVAAAGIPAIEPAGKPDPGAPGVRVVDAKLLRPYGLRSHPRPFTIIATGLEVPAGVPEPVVRFRHGRTLEWPRMRVEDLVVALLSVNERAALELARHRSVDRRRLRQRIRQEERVRQAITSGVVDVAWSHRHYLRDVTR